MERSTIQAIVLAAGKSTRLMNGKNKLIEKICGQPIIIFTTKLLEALGIQTTVVIGHQKELIKKTVQTYHPTGSINFATQETQLGTGHALACTQSLWQKDHILILNGDVPLITTEIIQSLISKHFETNAAISFVTAHHTEPNNSYGRVIKADSSHVKIIEAKDFQGESSDHCCINAGIYLVKKAFLEHHIDEIKQNNKSNEFYITDLVCQASDSGATVSTINAPFDQVRGINTHQELWAAEQIQRSHIIKHWMDNGVRFAAAHNIHIDLDVTIGMGTYLGNGVQLTSGTNIGSNCHIHECVMLEQAYVGNNCHIYPFSIIKNTTIGKNAQIGPFAHIKEGSSLADEVTIGNFVEIKQTAIGKGTKAKHLSYLGNAQIGQGVNVGAGTIVCNFDGKQKHTTVIKDQAFIGSNNTLVAPVTIAQGAYTAAGSTITDDVPENALAIGRTKQINKAEYATKLTRKQLQDDEEDVILCAGQSSLKKAEFMGATRTTTETLIENDSR